MNATHWFTAAAFAMLSTTVVGCSDDETVTPTTNPGTSRKDIVDTAAADASFTTLVTAVGAAGLESTLRGSGPFTVFAPTNDAFAKLPTFLTDKLLTAPYKTELGLILRYHVLAGSVKAADVLGKQSTVPTVLGAKVAIDGAGGKVVINGSATVITADLQASNGVVHVIGDVLLPTIADTAVGYDDGTTTFKTLVAALTAGELAETLGGPGPFTVFAPTDAAFAKIPKSTLDALLLPENKAQLQTILKYHVVAGTPVYARDVAAGSLTTLSGAVTITVSGSDVQLDAGGGKAKVVLTDLPASNGVTHVIDAVILPPS
jgi:uncharacterized surface protein with fasciclin (FAS1) repeats